MTRTYATLNDIADVMIATGCTEDVALAALLDTGSISEAIALVRSWVQGAL